MRRGKAPSKSDFKKLFRFQTWFNLRVLFLQRSKERELKRMNPDDKEETKMKTKMKVAVCTLLCMTMACAAANAEGGTTNSGRPQTQQSQMKNRKKKGMQQKLDDQNVPKDMPSRVDTRKLLEDGVIDEDTYNANISKRTRRRSRKANRMIPSSCRKSWRTKRMTTAPISPNCLKSAAVWMKRSSRACSMRV